MHLDSRRSSIHSLSFRSLLLLCACLPSWGCISVGSLQTADTLGAGNSRLTLRGTAQLQGTDQIGPEVSAGFQYGVSDTVDVGLRLFTLGAEVSGKVQLVPRESRTVVSLAPVAGRRDNAYFDGHRELYAGLPLLVGFRSDDDSQLVLGFQPMVRGLRGEGSEDWHTTFWLGTSVGYAWRVSDGVRLMPELAVSAPLPINGAPFRPVPQLGFAVLAGGRSRR
jgi:hypothetical protein